MVCFAKLSVPARALGLPMDVLSSVGVLRLEKATAEAIATAKEQSEQHGHGVDPLAEGSGCMRSSVGLVVKRVYFWAVRPSSPQVQSVIHYIPTGAPKECQL